MNDHRNEYQHPPTDSSGAPAPLPERPKSGPWGLVSAIGLALVFLWGKLKFLLPAVKFLKLGKILTTGGTMLLSVWAYALHWGWQFGVGFVLLIFIHEMGHVFVAWRQGLPVSAPIFIPFMGALILQKKESKSAWDQAVMGIGGPIGGALGAVLCHLIYAQTGSTLFLGLAYVGYMLNLFNLMPVLPLDGGWIVGAVSPWLWLVGLIGLIFLYFSDVVHNPFILLIVLLSLPRLWHGLRNKGAPPGGIPATGEQRWRMGLLYLALAGILGWAMAATFEDPRSIRAKNDRAEPRLAFRSNGGLSGETL